ncbi:unnamed protein product [marine sediment metagenome]|uniref:Uncharacterized protein n=1 Tax=marine sediment metagenome TaxID=412755 RepID=X1U6J4_9ZZZZ
MVGIYSSETEKVLVPVALLENWDRRLELLQALCLLMKLLIDDMKSEEQSRRWRVLWPVSLS